MENKSRAKELMKPVLKTEHYWCEDTFYACAAHIEYGGIDESGECDCGIDEYNAKIIKAIASLLTAEQEKVVEIVDGLRDLTEVRCESEGCNHCDDFVDSVDQALTALKAHFNPPTENKVTVYTTKLAKQSSTERGKQGLMLIRY